MEIDKELEEARERLKKTHRNQKISGARKSEFPAQEIEKQFLCAPKTREFSSEGREEKKPAEKEKKENEEIEDKLEPAEENFAEFEMSRARESVRAPVLAQDEEAGGSLDSMFTPPLKKDDEDKKGKEEGPRYNIQQEAKKYERNAVITTERLTPREFAIERRFEDGMRPVKVQEQWRGGGERTERMDVMKYSSERVPEREDLFFMKKEKGNIREAKKYY